METITQELTVKKLEELFNDFKSDYSSDLIKNLFNDNSEFNEYANMTNIIFDVEDNKFTFLNLQRNVHLQCYVVATMENELIKIEDMLNADYTENEETGEWVDTVNGDIFVSKDERNNDFITNITYWFGEQSNINYIEIDFEELLSEIKEK